MKSAIHSFALVLCLLLDIGKIAKIAKPTVETSG
jgi:hypothetical protein